MPGQGHDVSEERGPFFRWPWSRRRKEPGIPGGGRRGAAGPQDGGGPAADGPAGGGLAAAGLTGGEQAEAAGVPASPWGGMQPGGPAGEWKAVLLRPPDRGVRRAYRMLVERWGASPEGLRVAWVPGLVWVADDLAVAGVGQGLVVARPRPDRRVQLYHASFDQSVTFSAGRLEADPLAPWTNPLRHLLFSWLQAGMELTGVDGVILGDGSDPGPTSAPLAAACLWLCWRPSWVGETMAAVWGRAGLWPGRWAAVAQALRLLTASSGDGPRGWSLVVLPTPADGEAATGRVVADPHGVLAVWRCGAGQGDQPGAQPPPAGRLAEGMLPEALGRGDGGAVGGWLEKVRVAGKGGPAGSQAGSEAPPGGENCPLWVALPHPQEPLQLRLLPWGLLGLSGAGAAGAEPEVPAPASVMGCQIRRGRQEFLRGRGESPAGRS